MKQYFKTITGIIQHLIAMILVVLLIVSLIPGYYEQFSAWFLLLIVIQMVLSITHLRFVNLFFETIFLILMVLGFIPFGIGWLFRFIAIPIALLDMASFNQGAVFQKVEIFTKDSVKSRYDNFKEKKRTKNKNKKLKNKEKIIDAEFNEK